MNDMNKLAAEQENAEQQPSLLCCDLLKVGLNCAHETNKY